jgi:hypothetical protein
VKKLIDMIRAGARRRGIVIIKNGNAIDKYRKDGNILVSQIKYEEVVTTSYSNLEIFDL